MDRIDSVPPRPSRLADKAKFANFVRLASLALLLCVFSAECLLAAPPVVHMNGDRITVRARENTLQEVLRELASQGVRVRVDPAVEARVHGDLIGQPINEALKLLLGAYGYSTRWGAVEGPVGKIKILQSVDVYRVGNSGAVRTMRIKGRRGFDVVTDPDGVEYIRDQLLVGVRPGTSKEEFMNMVNSIGGRVVDVVKELGIYKIALAPNSDVRKLSAHLNANFPFAKTEPNYAMRQSEPSPVPGEAGAAGSDVAGAAPGEPGAPAAAGSAAAPAAPGAATASAAPPTSAPPGTPAVAILDSGLSPDIKLGDLLVGSYDATNPDLAISDTRGHGSQMAGIVSGSVTPAGMQPVGEAGGTPVVAIRSFDDQGTTSNFTMMRAIDYAQDNGASVLSLSWGSEGRSEFMESSIAQAQDQGMVVVAAVGNKPNGVATYPAAYDGVIGVGALTGNGEVWENSNYGNFVDVTAPGQANFPIGHDGPPGDYSGTSISTPVVASAIAQYLTLNPGASQDAMSKDFYDSLTPAGDAALYGQGKFDEAARQRFLTP